MGTPVKMIAYVTGLDATQSRFYADLAVKEARSEMPKFWGARWRLNAIWGRGYYGISWSDSYVWFQNKGISAFTMNSLKGKTIPMWVTDEDGSLRAKNPKIEQRTRDDGTQQVLIFRRASRPGAPGRISKRAPNGQIAKGNVGVKWRHPGLDPKNFLDHGVWKAASKGNLVVTEIIVVDEYGNPTSP